MSLSSGIFVVHIIWYRVSDLLEIRLDSASSGSKNMQLPETAEHVNDDKKSTAFAEHFVEHFKELGMNPSTTHQKSER